MTLTAIHHALEIAAARERRGWPEYQMNVDDWYDGFTYMALIVTSDGIEAFIHADCVTGQARIYVDGNEIGNQEWN